MEKTQAELPEKKLTPSQAWHDFIGRIYQPDNWKTVSRKMRGEIAKANKRFKEGRLKPKGLISILERTKPEWYRSEIKVVIWKQNH